MRRFEHGCDTDPEKLRGVRHRLRAVAQMDPRIEGGNGVLARAVDQCVKKRDDVCGLGTVEEHPGSRNYFDPADMVKSSA